MRKCFSAETFLKDISISLTIMWSDYCPLQVQFFAHFLSDLNKSLKLKLFKIEQEEIMIYPKHLGKSSLLFSSLNANLLNN